MRESKPLIERGKLHMKTKLISIFTVTALLVTSISTVAFAHDSYTTKNGIYLSKADKNVDKQKYEDRDEERETVAGSVYKGEKGDKPEKVDELSVKEVTNALVTNVATKTPAEVIDLLLTQNVPLYKIVKAFNYISENEDNAEVKLTEAQLKAYADAISAKIEQQKTAIQERIDALQELTNLYDKLGDLEKAINAQKKAIMSDYKNILSYKKIGEVFNKKGDKDIKVFTVGEQVYFDVQPVIKSDRTLVPIRAIAESLKADVKWDEATKTITMTKDGVEIKLVLGSDIAIIDGKEVKLDVPAETLNNRTLVPVRFISEAFKSTVQWEPEHQIVIIY